MTVEELIEELKKYDNNLQVETMSYEMFAVKEVWDYDRDCEVEVLRIGIQLPF